MVESISRHIGRALLVSIPAVFDDIRCRPCVLIRAEIHGLWLRSDELTRRLAPAEGDYTAAEPVVFVPFTQIAAVLAPTRAPSPVKPPTAAEAAPTTKVSARKKRAT